MAGMGPLGLVFSDLLRMQLTSVTGPAQSMVAYGTISGRQLVGRSALAASVVWLSGTFN